MLQWWTSSQSQPQIITVTALKHNFINITWHWIWMYLNTQNYCYSTRFSWHTPENKHGKEVPCEFRGSLLVSLPKSLGKLEDLPLRKTERTILKPNLIGNPPTVFASLASVDNFTQIVIVLRVTNLNYNEIRLSWDHPRIQPHPFGRQGRFAHMVSGGFSWFPLTQTNQIMNMSNLNVTWMSPVIDTSCKTIRSLRCFVAWSSISTTWRVRISTINSEWVYRWWWNAVTLRKHIRYT